MLTIEIETDNDATQSSYDLAELLEDIADKILNYYTRGVVRDRNGNTVGNWAWER